MLAFRAVGFVETVLLLRIDVSLCQDKTISVYFQKYFLNHFLHETSVKHFIAELKKKNCELLPK